MGNTRKHRPRRSWWLPRADLLRRPYVAEVLSVNDDFTDRVTDVPDLLLRRQPLIVGVQEGKRTDYGQAVTDKVGWPYGLRQDLSSEARAGVAVLWDRRRARPLGDAVDQPGKLGGGWQQLIPARSGLLARGVCWQDLEVRVGPVGLRRRLRIRAASSHRPPPRDRHLWPEFDRELAIWCAGSRLPVVLFMDCNEAGGPSNLLRMVGLRWHGVHFDGVLTKLPVVGEAEALARGSSDHRPVSVAIKIPRQTSPAR